MRELQLLVAHQVDCPFIELARQQLHIVLDQILFLAVEQWRSVDPLERHIQLLHFLGIVLDEAMQAEQHGGLGFACEEVLKRGVESVVVCHSVHLMNVVIVRKKHLYFSSDILVILVNPVEGVDESARIILLLSLVVCSVEELVNALSDVIEKFLFHVLDRA